MTAPTPVDPSEVAAGLRRLLDAIPASWERPRDRPMRYRLEGAFVCASLLAGLEPFDDSQASPDNANAVAQSPLPKGHYRRARGNSVNVLTTPSGPRDGSVGTKRQT